MKELNCRGLSCPQPILQLTKTMKTMDPGDQVTVLASDKAFEADIRAWVSRTGNTLVSFESEGPLSSAIIEKV
jgi:tRNA 2-thiouridine synthesizing protein A